MSSHNIFTKRITEDCIEEGDLVSNLDIAEPVRELYYEYKKECDKYYLNLPAHDIANKKYYVYAWYADMNPKRYFYVGKGTGKRYRHIKEEIAKGKNGSNNIRWERYAMIDSKNGTNYEIVLDHLTEYEAIIYEQCLKLKIGDSPVESQINAVEEGFVNSQIMHLNIGLLNP